MKDRKYCLQPAACKMEDGKHMATICNPCLTSLRNGNIPEFSLVKFDPGAIPVAENPAEQLLPLTMIEANLLSPNRVVRYLFVMRPWGNPEAIQKGFKGHVIAFENNTPDKLLSAIPLPLSQIPEAMECVFLTVASEKEEREKIARKSKALHVRGKQIKLWAIHLCKVSWADGRADCFILFSC